MTNAVAAYRKMMVSDLVLHKGHKLTIATYGRGDDIRSIAIECVECFTTLWDYEDPEVPSQAEEQREFVLADIRVGDIIAYYVGGEYRRVELNEVSADIKNGEPGFAGYLLDMEGERRYDTGWTSDATKPLEVWGYLDQLDSILCKGDQW